MAVSTTKTTSKKKLKYFLIFLLFSLLNVYFKFWLREGLEQNFFTNSLPSFLGAISIFYFYSLISKKNSSVLFWSLFFVMVYELLQIFDSTASFDYMDLIAAFLGVMLSWFAERRFKFSAE